MQIPDPTLNSGERFPAVTSEQRRNTCVHEAAHAVIHALDPFCLIYGVEVAPLGSTRWGPTRRPDLCAGSLLGNCETTDAPIRYCITWRDGDDGRYLFADKRMYQESLKSSGKKIARQARDSLRAYVRGTMAGPIADGLFQGLADEEIELNPPDDDPTHDLQKAEAFCRLLPYRNEYEKLFTQTTGLLRDPIIWKRVIAFADALEKSGGVEGTELSRLLDSAS